MLACTILQVGHGSHEGGKVQIEGQGGGNGNSGNIGLLGLLLLLLFVWLSEEAVSRLVDDLRHAVLAPMVSVLSH